MRIDVQVQGDKIIYTKMFRSATRAVYAQAAMNDLVIEIMDIIDATFESQGRRGGGSWKFILPETIRRKARAGQDVRILHAEYALRDSLTSRGDPNNVVEVMSDRLFVGSTLPYAARQNRERPFIRLTQYDKAVFKKIIADHVLAGWRGRRSNNRAQGRRRTR